MDAAYLKSKITNSFMRSETLLGMVKILDRSSRETPAYNDPKYLPFYYHLGTQCTPKRVIQVGSKLGLIGACFSQGCKTIERWLAIDEYSDNPPHNIILSNLRMYSEANIAYRLFDNGLFVDNDADLCLLTEKYSLAATERYIELLWKSLRSEGLLVVDYIHDEATKKSFTEFCKVRNREPVLFDTRYGLGVVNK